MRSLTVIAMVLGWAAVARGQFERPNLPDPVPHEARNLTLDQALAELPKYRFGADQSALDAVDEAARQTFGKGAERAALEKSLDAILAGDATADAKQFICRKLCQIGTDASVPALAKLLTDEKCSHMARAALEQIGTAAADSALREAIGKVKGELLIGVISSVGDRRDENAWAQLTDLIKSGDEAVRCAAVSSLGKIGTPKATTAVLSALWTAEREASEPFKQAAADAALNCAAAFAAEGKAEAANAIYADLVKQSQSMHVRAAALRGMAKAGGADATKVVVAGLESKELAWQLVAAECVPDIKDDRCTAILVGMLPKLSADVQAALLNSLAMRGDRSALPAVMELMATRDGKVRLAAIDAAGALGDESVVAKLAQVAAESRGEEQAAARAAMDGLKGEAASTKMIELLAGAKPALQVEIIRSLAARDAKQAVPAMLKLAAGGEELVRVAALEAMASLGSTKEAGDLAKLLAQAKADGERTAGVEAIASVARRVDASERDAMAAGLVEAMKSADDANKAAILRALGRIGGKPALAALRDAAKDGGPETSDAAVRAMGECDDPAVWEDLVALAKSAPRENQKILATRGLIRLVGSLKLQSGQQLARYRQIMPLASRAEEKRLILAGIGGLRTAGALRATMEYLDDASVQTEAAMAAVNIAKSLKGQTALVRESMQKIIGTCKDARAKSAAQGVLGMGRSANQR